MNINSVREQYPQYSDMSDSELADAIHSKFYSDLPKNDVYTKLGVQTVSGMDQAKDAAASFSSGVVKGSRELAELPADMNSGAQWLADKAGNYFGVDAPNIQRFTNMIPGIGGLNVASRGLKNYLQGDNAIAQGVRKVEGYKPKTDLGSVSKKVGQFVPGAVGGGGAMANAVRMGKYALAPGLGAAAGEKLTEGTGYEGLGEAVGGLVGLSGGAILNRAAEKIARSSMSTADDFERAGKLAYEEAKDANVLIKNDTITRMKSGLAQHLDDIGFLPGSEQKANAILNDVFKNLESNPSRLFKGRGAQTGFGQNPLNIWELDKVGAKIKDKIKDLDPNAKGDRRILWAAKHYIDDFAQSLGPNDILAGDYQRGIKALQEGKKHWKTKSKLELMDQMEDSAQHTGNAVYTRGGVPHADRREALKFLRKDKNKRQSLTNDELKGLQRVSDQDWLTNRARSLGKMVDSPYSAASTLAIPAGVIGLNVASGGTAAILAALGAGVGVGARALHKIRVDKSKNDVRSLIINGRKLDRPWNTVLGKLQSLNTIRNQESED